MKQEKFVVEQNEKGDVGGPSPLRVLVAHEHFLTREGLTQLLASDDSIEVVGACGDEQSTLDAVAADPPDLLLTAVSMPPTWSDEGLRISAQLRITHPDVGVVLLTANANIKFAAELVRLGANKRGYLLKDHVGDVQELVSALHSVAGGDCVIDPGMVTGMVNDVGDVVPLVLQVLTDRQRELLAEIAQGKSNSAMAQDRHITVRAVEKHVSEIFARLGVNGDLRVSRRVRAALLYLESGRESERVAG